MNMQKLSLNLLRKKMKSYKYNKMASFRESDLPERKGGHLSS